MRVCFTGHRPSKLPGGYNYYSEKNIKLGKELRKEIIKLINKGADYFICGGALGVDQIAFMVLQKLKAQGYNIFIEVAVPFKNQHLKWSKEQQDRYLQQLDLADKVTYVDTLFEYNKTLPPNIYSIRKLESRNQYMVDNSDVIVAVWNGSPSGTANCIQYAKEIKKEIIIINNIFSDLTL